MIQNILIDLGGSVIILFNNLLNQEYITVIKLIKFYILELDGFRKKVYYAYRVF